LDRVIALDERRRALLPELEGLRAEQNEANGRIKSASDAAEREREIAAMRTVAERVKELQHAVAEVEQGLRRRSRRCPTSPTRPPRPGPRTSSCAGSGRCRSSTANRATTWSWRAG